MYSPVLQRLPDGSYLSELIPKAVRFDLAAGKKRRADRYRIPVRVAEYTITNRGHTAEKTAEPAAEPQTIRLVTSILDHELAPAAELAALYHQRWEVELAFDEIETHQIGHRVLRSRSPQLVRQEIWAPLLTHYAIRHLMFEAWWRTIRSVRRKEIRSGSVSMSSAASATRRHFPPSRLATTIKTAIAEIIQRLNLPRRPRSCPRAIKKKRLRSDTARRPRLQDHQTRPAHPHSAAPTHRITERH
jgi:hypothetical protein